MPQDSITSAAAQAGLTAKQKAQVDGLQRLLDSHKGLLALPAPVAQQKYGGREQLAVGCIKYLLLSSSSSLVGLG